MEIDIQELIQIIKKVAKQELLPRFEKVSKEYKLDETLSLNNVYKNCYINLIQKFHC